MNNKRKVFVVAVAVCLIAILSLSSLAWFSDADAVTNNFVVSGGDGDSPDKIFSIDVMEKVDMDGDGVADATVGANTDPSEYTYKHIVPGDMLYKRPSAQNTGAYAQWVRFKVTIDNANAWVAVMQQYGYEVHDLMYLEDKTTKLTESPDWTFAAADTDVVDNKLIYTFYYDKVVEPTDWVVSFTYVKIPEELTQYDMDLLENGKFQMVVTGEAIQADNTGDNAYDAFMKVLGK